MAAVRLTSLLKDRIQRNIELVTFKTRIAAHQKTGQELLLTLFNSMVTAEQYAAMKAMPDGFFSTRDNLHVRIIPDDGGYGKYYTFHFPEGVSRLMPARMLLDTLAIDLEHPLSAAFNAWVKEEKAIEKDSYTLRSQVRTILDQCTTLTKLRDAWGGDIDQYLPADLEEKKALPAIPVEDVKALMGQMGQAA